MMLKHAAAAAMIAGALACGCASNPARASAAVPLDVPEPPPRQPIAPVPVTAAPPDATAAPPTVKTNPPPQISSPAPVAVAVPAAAPPPAPAPTPQPPASPPPDLQSAGTSGRTLTRSQVLELLNRTKGKLALIDRRKLSAGKSADYDSAQRFLTQAEGAVKANNLLLAQSSGEKAETLADGLR